MKLSKREKRLILLLIVIVVVYGYYNYLYFPLANQIVILEKENRLLAAALQSSTIQDLEMKQPQQKTDEEYRRLAEKVPQYAFIPETITFFEEIAVSNSIIIKSLSYEDSLVIDDNLAEINYKSLTKIKSSSYKIVLTGNYTNLMNFIAHLENAPRLFGINDIRIQVIGDYARGADSELLLTANFYAYHHS
ncbi:MAG: hypothetical protein ACOX0E_07705 [Syntrophomonadaceae bacterium]